jgi:hypothetical protein
MRACVYEGVRENLYSFAALAMCRRRICGDTAAFEFQKSNKYGHFQALLPVKARQ